MFTQIYPQGVIIIIFVIIIIMIVNYYYYYWLLHGFSSREASWFVWIQWSSREAWITLIQGNINLNFITEHIKNLNYIQGGFSHWV